MDSRQEKREGEVRRSPRGRLGIVGSWEKGPNGLDISLEKFQKWGAAEVYCRLDEYRPHMRGGALVSIAKGEHLWRGQLISSRRGSLIASPGFTPRDFAEEVGAETVGHYLVVLDPDTPATSEIIGAEAFVDR